MNLQSKIFFIGIQVILAVAGIYHTDAIAEEKTDKILGGVIIMRNCPKSEIKSFRFTPSDVRGGGWAEITKDDQRVRIQFDSYTPDDLERFNRLGNQIEPKINVMVYHGDFLFFVKSTSGSFKRLPEPDPTSKPSPLSTNLAI